VTRRPSWLAPPLVVGTLFVSAAVVFAAAAVPATLRLPRRDPSHAPGVPAALFSHRGHAAFGCQACHPSMFPQSSVAFTHEEMKTGRYCGACHDGNVAFAIAGAACGGCHVPPR
jgi:c(7)-type cytochrome triheme protein